jgi:hypothetical protein
MFANKESLDKSRHIEAQNRKSPTTRPLINSYFRSIRPLAFSWGLKN